MYSNELQLELIGGNCMDKIAMVKKEIQLQNWSDKELARQESGLTVTEWCRQEKISTSTYYYRLRRIRENLCEQIPVAVTEITEKTETDSAAIRIISGDLKVEISSDVPSEKIAAIIGALKCVTEQLKADNQMLWVKRMNNIRSRATEIVNAELIYI